jgi:hypothetical protein
MFHVEHRSAAVGKAKQVHAQPPGTQSTLKCGTARSNGWRRVKPCDGGINASRSIDSQSGALRQPPGRQVAKDAMRTERYKCSVNRTLPCGAGIDDGRTGRPWRALPLCHGHRPDLSGSWPCSGTGSKPVALGTCRAEQRSAPGSSKSSGKEPNQHWQRR